MAKKKSKSKSPSFWERFLPEDGVATSAKRVGAALAVVAVCIGIAVSSQFVRSSVEQQERFFLDNWQMDFGNFPAWVTPEIEREITQVNLARGESLSLFRGEVLEELRKRLVFSPWVREVGGIELRYPTSSSTGAIQAQLVLREPVAIVEAAGQFYLADGAGVRLGGVYPESPQHWFRLPVVRGSGELAQIPKAGSHWQASDVLEAIEVARLLHANGIHRDYPHWPITAIDVANVGGRQDPRAGDIVLLCDGKKLVWGRSPLSSGSRTISTEDLLANLRQVLNRMHEAEWKLVKLHYSRPVTEG